MGFVRNKRFSVLELVGLAAFLGWALSAYHNALPGAFADAEAPTSEALINCAVPHVFSPNTLADANQVNANFAALVACIQSLDERTQFISIVQGDLDGLAGPHMLIEGANIHVRSGTGATDDFGTLAGLGNLVVGYDENAGGRNRSGSHNLVIGRDHTYSSFAGIVAGEHNKITGDSASVVGGQFNEASDSAAAVLGGGFNLASKLRATVSGGENNTSSQIGASVAGGHNNLASAGNSTAVGGENNVAGAPQSVVVGGEQNQTTATRSAILGG
ncbi:MAG: hypothetical protein KDA71_12295, partial [Planctomycetales bacterium]|nr:hypothetical protein [Planctomycetales bacterium]